MEASVIVSIVAVAVAAVSFFYNIGKDSKGTASADTEETKLDQIYSRLESVDTKIDRIAEWQRKATEIHASHEERIRTLFNRLDIVEHRLEDRQVMNQALKKILEKIEGMG